MDQLGTALSDCGKLWSCRACWYGVVLALLALGDLNPMLLT
jgi:hypothetical protein